MNGVIGGSQQFDGVSASIEMPGTANSKLNFPANSTYTVSAWVFMDTISGKRCAIVDKRNFQYGLEACYKDNTWDFYQFNAA